MTGERMYPILPCPDLDEALEFYAALGFRRTYLQRRPYPHAVVERDDMAVHLSGIDGFDPAGSVSSVVVVVPDPGALHASFTVGLRARYGRLPVAGFPRLLRVRRKQGTATGFSVVDTGGCWLRFYAVGATEDAADDDVEEGGTGPLDRALDAAARQGDSRGDEAGALAVLDRALARHPDGADPSRTRALLYRAELLVRLGRTDEAAAVLEEAEGLDRAAGPTVPASGPLAEELEHLRALLREAGRQG